HSLTLALATLGLVHVPARATEAAIALSILLLAVELTRRPPSRSVDEVPRETLTRRFPWLVAALFGLLHGLGFAGALSEIGLPTGAVPAALFAFNVGVELGQLIFVAAALSLGALLARAPRLGELRRRLLHAALPYALGVSASYLLIARVASFFQG
ncbi:MAG: HupE/UreJ family protein, partial [Deltaproteobacteria bacterium]|nr:HupE/UreJ family protein [Deltaproteobacteria bacterium]